MCMTYTIGMFAVKKTPDDGKRNCPKHVEFYSKNKFVKLVHLVGFIVRISYFPYKGKVIQLQCGPEGG